MREIGKPKEEYDHDNILRLLNGLQTSQGNKALVEEWDTELFAKGNKWGSRNQYLQSIYCLLRWKPNKGLTQFSRNDLIKFKEHLTKATYSRNGSKPSHYSPRTIESYLSAIREFYRWQKKGELMDWFQTKRHTTGRLKAEEILTQEDILKLVTAAKSKRDKAFIFCLWESGCRRGEFLNLKIGDLHFEENLVSFTTIDGKTGRRPCYLVASVPSLIQHLEEHAYKNNKEAWLWQKQ